MNRLLFARSRKLVLEMLEERALLDGLGLTPDEAVVGEPFDSLRSDHSIAPVAASLLASDEAEPKNWNPGNEGDDIGNPALTGSHTYESGTGVYVVNGGGADIWDGSDQFYYVHQPLIGTGEIIAKVNSVENTDPWAKAGVMIRESLDANSMHAMIVVTPENGVSFQRRTSTGGVGYSTTTPGLSAPYWVKVVRQGETFMGYSSADGSSWTFVGSDTIPMSRDAHIGLAVTAHDDSVLCTAEFQDVSAGKYFGLYIDDALTTPGLVGSYVNESLRAYQPQDDWRVTQTIAGTRIDPAIEFVGNGWGSRSAVGLTGGTDEDWENFSVQWDGFIEIVADGISLATISDDGSRMWIDINDDGVFAASSPEFVDNNWGSDQSPTQGPPSVALDAGVYRIRFQYEEGSGGNVMAIVAPTTETIALGDVVVGEIGIPGEVDEYEFTVAAEETIFFDVQYISGTTNDHFDFTLLAPDGSTRFAEDAPAWRHDDADHGPSLLSETGTYRLVVDGRGDDVASYRFQLWDMPESDFTKHVIDGSFDGAEALFATDLDGDVDIDFAAVAWNANEVAWYEYNPQSGSYQKHAIETSFDFTLSVSVADIDGDGNADIIATARDGDQVAWWENGPDGFAIKHVIDDDFNGAHKVFAIDLDQDADVDVIATARYADQIAWWENDGFGNLTKHIVDDLFDGARGVQAADLDDDGDLDIVASARDGNEVAWWENDGSQNFTKSTIDDQLDGAQDVHVADVDGNGRFDVLATAWDTDDLVWYRQQPDGTFIKEIIDGSFDGAQGIDTADFDADGDLDIVATADDGDHLVWWENRGGGVFHKIVLDSSFDGASGVVAEDLDGDGDIDILAAADDGDQIAWWENDLLDRISIAEMTPTVGGASDQPVDSVDIRFTAEVNPATVTEASLQVIDAGPDWTLDTPDDVALVAESVVYDAGQRTATLQLSAPLGEGRYRVIVTDDVRSTKGVLLDGDGEYQSHAPDDLPSGNGEAGGDFVSAFSVDFTPPTDPARLRSYSHTVGQWSEDDTIEVTWSASRDTLSGLAGYHASWDGVPDTAPETVSLLDANTVLVESPMLGDGDVHYFHLVAVDRAGNLSGAQHLGPFYIENGGPTVRFVSPADNTVQLQWPEAIRIGFHDYDVDPTTVTTSSFVVLASGGDGSFGDGNEIEIQDSDGAIEYDLATRTATLIPATPLPEDVYRITLLDTVTDVLGKPLDGDADGQPGGPLVSRFQFFAPQEVSGTISEDTLWRGLLIVTDRVTVSAGTTLAVEPGAIVKFNDDGLLKVLGSLDIQGTLSHPVIFTSSKDDTVGGDSNLDGDATSPAVADWTGILVASAEANAVLENTQICYADRALRLTAGTARLRNTILQDNNHGIYVYSPFVEVDADNLLVANNRLSGVFVRADSRMNLRNATIVGNGFAGSSGWHRAGIHVGAAAVTIENSIIAFNAHGLNHSGDPPLVTVRNSAFYNPDGKEISWDGDPGKPDLDRNGNLTLDPLFVNRAAGNYELANGSPCIDAGRSINAPATDILGRPRLDDSGVANLGSGAVPYVDMGAFERQQDSTPLDLAVAAVSAPMPESVGEGETFEVTWTVSSTGQRTATGSWEDAVYLSRDVHLDPTDILVGTIVHTDELLPGGSYSASLSTTVPDTAGLQYVLVRTNSTRALRESDETNNVGVSDGVLEIAVTELTLDGSVADTVYEGQWRFFRFDADPGATIRFDLDSDVDHGTVGLYLRRGAIPTLATYDAFATTYAQPDQQVRLLDPLPDTYYVGVYGQWLSSGSTGFTLSAEATPLELHSIAQTTVSNTGQATIELLGSNFAADDNIVLLAPDGQTELTPLDTFYENSGQVFATFDMTGALPGTYDVEVRAELGEVVMLADAITVVSDGGPEFFMHMTHPSRTRPGRKATITVEYGNAGTTDVLSPLITLTSDDDMQWRIPGTEEFVIGGAFQFMALSADGPANVLRPGQTETIDIKITTPFREATIPYASFWLCTQSTELIDWDDIQEDSRPPAVTAETWEAVWTNMETQVGDTWGDYVAMLGDNAAYLDRLGQSVYDAATLFQFEVLQAYGLSSYSALASSEDAYLAAPGIAVSLSRVFGQTIPSRYRLGSFGWGWTHNYDLRLEQTNEGTMLMHGPSGGYRSFTHLDDGTYQAGPGDYGILTQNGDGTYSLREKTGVVYRFGTDLLFESLTDPNANTITASYSSGHLTQLTHSSGQWLQFQYNADGRIEQVADHTGRQTTYEYDTSGEYLLRVTEPGDRVTEYQYRTGGSIAAEHALLMITYPGGNHQYYTYDDHGRLLGEHLDGGAEPLTFAYDSVGTVTVSDALQAATRLFFDARGLLVRAEDSLGRQSQVEYDADYNVVHTVRPDGLGYAYDYDELGNMTEIVDPMGHVTIFGYETDYSNLVWFRDARGNATQYEYDANGNPTAIVYPDDSREQFEVDLLGNLIQSTNRRGNPIDYTYNDDGLLIRKDYADGKSNEYIYDAFGRMVAAVDSHGTTTMEYDDADRLTKITYPQGRYLAYTYDAAGRRTQMVDQDGFETNYAYDDVGRLDVLTDADGSLVVDYTYDAAGRVVREDKGNGTYMTYDYDPAGRLLRLINYGPDDSIHSRFDYAYDELGCRTSMNTIYGHWTYGYDAIGQLTRAVLDSTDPDIPDHEITYVYDAVGNRISVTDNGIMTWYETNNLDQYTTVGTAVYTYDHDGNLMSKVDGTNVWSYQYDDENRLVRVTEPENTWEYEYGALGHRVARIQDGGKTQYFVDPTAWGNLIGEYNDTTAEVARYMYGYGLISHVDTSEVVAYYSFDGIGSTSGTTDASGLPVNTYVYDPFGYQILCRETTANPFAYVGRLGVFQESDTLSFMRARYYSSCTGAFLGIDPLRIPLPNRYTYAENDPIAGVDPTGMFRIGLGLGISGFGPDGMGGAASSEVYYNPVTGDFGLNNGLSTGIGIPGVSTGLSLNITDLPFGNGTPYASLSLPGFSIDFDPYGGINGVSLDLSLIPEGVSLTRPIASSDIPLGTVPHPFRPPVGGGPWGLPLTIICLLFPELCTPSDSGDSGNEGSRTPEDKFGPVGFDAPDTPAEELMRFVPAGGAFNYRIDFWNHPDAVVPTQDAVIVDQLDPNLDWSTFSFTNFGFLKWNVDLPGGQVIDMQVDLRPDMNLAVNVRGTFDPETSEIRWWFQAVDPVTGDYPEDPMAGFLPPFNEETQYELGWVEFTVEPNADLATGARIENQAFVQFDFVGPFNPAPKPDPWLNTIDAAGPNSAVDPLPATTTATEFLVTWSGDDDLGGSGVAVYDIYYRVDDEPFSLWLNDTAETSATFSAEFGHTYAFYSVATDNVGHREPRPVEPDAEITVEQGTGDAIVVNSTADPGDGVPDATETTLREAIEAANADLGWDRIVFDIPETDPGFDAATGTFLIQPTSALPIITDPVEIDGYTQAGAQPNTASIDQGTNAVLKIVLDGSQAGEGVDGLRISGGSSSIEGLVIHSFGRFGVQIDSNGDNVVAGNFIGTDDSGSVALGNGSDGIAVFTSERNLIGGTTPEARNVISGNAGQGVGLAPHLSRHNVIQGNFIGTDATATVAIPNAGNGVRADNTPYNTIGGTEPGARNVISGNAGYGVALAGDDADGNLVLGNFIGTDVTGTMDLGNDDHGIYVNNGANNVIGGTEASARNVISGNDWCGIHITGAEATGNQILGNYIGVDVTGNAALGNAADGIWIVNAPANFIGGTEPGSGNVVSANVRFGIEIEGTDAAGNVVAGNYVGTNATGDNDLGNLRSGVLITGQAFGTLIGGLEAGAGNVISGNENWGVEIRDSDNSQILGNVVGLNVSGTEGLGNSHSGVVLVNASGTQIGSAATAGRNLISANAHHGIDIAGEDATATRIQGNYIGTDITGGQDLGNTGEGIYVHQQANGTLIGGSEQGAGNLISGNDDDGIDLRDSSGCVIAGNLIGTDATGLINLGNDDHGINVINGANNTIGGTDASARNVISGNENAGILIYGDTATGNVVAGNYIGLDTTGGHELGNGDEGIRISGAADNTIGGTQVGAGNVISGNGSHGVSIHLTGAEGNRVLGNLIGLNAVGTAAIGNIGDGVFFNSAAAYNVVGGPTAAERNVIAANADGIQINGDYNGESHDNVVLGNYIGSDVSGAVALGNREHGIHIRNAFGNTIGGTDSDQGNLIAFNGQAGVAIYGNSSLGNSIRGNSIFENDALGIDLGGDGVTPNDIGDADIGPNGLLNAPVLTQVVQYEAGMHVLGGWWTEPGVTLTLDFYSVTSADPSGFGEGWRHLGSAEVISQPDGRVAIDLQLATILGQQEQIVATVTDQTGSTSEFSHVLQPNTPPIVGRYVFYNNSAFDDEGRGLSDDDALAIDKIALLPGQTATFANYTSYSRGINGVMVDIVGLADPEHVGVDEFTFRVGSTNDPASWSTAPGPSGISVRQGAGVDGTNRVTIIWDDNAIQKQWLQVTVLAENLGLAANDVFYFGNAIGESGNSTTDAKVNATDMLAARNNQRSFIDPAPVDFDYDYDRDARVNATDMLIARNNQTNFLTALKLITVPAGKALAENASGIRQAAANDAVLRQATRGDSERRDAHSGKLAWLYEYELKSTQDRLPNDDNASRRVVETLLASL